MTYTLADGRRCDDCGEPIHVVGYCGACDDRRAREKRIEDGNEYRRQSQIRLELAEVRKRTRAHVASKQVTACCGAPVREWHNDGGADEDSCRDCDEELCSHCASVFEREDGYGDDGKGIRTFALCDSCHGDREYKRQRREARNDSGV